MIQNMDLDDRSAKFTRNGLLGLKADEVTLSKLEAISEVELLQKHRAAIDELIRRKTLEQIPQG